MNPVSVARFKDLCIDAVDPERLGTFWAAATGLRWNPAGQRLYGSDPEQTIWVNQVPEAHSVKNRVHLDVSVQGPDGLDRLTGSGASVLSVPTDEQPWTVLADVEGNEFCAFVRQPAAGTRSSEVFEMVVDSADAQSQATWWQQLVGGRVGHDEQHPWYWLTDVPGLPFESWVFGPVPEPKTMKNRVHWDVSAPALRPVLDAGARLIRAADDEISWYVCADPGGNEFCVFLPDEAEPDEGVA